MFKGPKELFNLLLSNGYEVGRLQSIRNEVYWLVVLNGWSRKYRGVDAMGFSRDFYDENYPVDMLISGGILVRKGKWRME